MNYDINDSLEQRQLSEVFLGTWINWHAFTIPSDTSYLSHPLIYTAANVSENALCSSMSCENFSIRGRRRTSGMVGINS